MANAYSNFTFYVQSDHDIQQRVERTLSTRTSSKKILTFDLQTTVIQRKSDVSDSALLCLQLETASSKKYITKIGLLVNLDHICTDGIGIRIIAGLFLRLFAQKISSGSHEENVDLEWQDSASELSPP
jgi:hypothetical protein